MVLLSALRPRHWLKNLLVVVAPLTAGSMTMLAGYQLLIAFVSLSFAASAMYLVNDVRDRSRDQDHPSKRFRAIASGKVTPATAFALAAVLLGISGALGWLLSPAFFATVVAYVVATLVYSLWLKSAPAVDIVLLASFFVLRIFAGGLATQVEVSSWLLATSFFAFLSIAAAKRVVELSVMAESSEGGFVSGRGYVSTDLGVVQTVGVGVGISSALLLGLYVETGIAASNFSSPQLLWLTVPLWIYWVLRFWIIVSRGKVDHDPIEFVLKDWISYAVVVALALLLVIAQ